MNILHQIATDQIAGFVRESPCPTCGAKLSTVGKPSLEFGGNIAHATQPVTCQNGHRELVYKQVAYNAELMGQYRGENST